MSEARRTILGIGLLPVGDPERTRVIIEAVALASEGFCPVCRGRLVVGERRPWCPECRFGFQIDGPDAITIHASFRPNASD